MKERYHLVINPTMGEEVGGGSLGDASPLFGNGFPPPTFS